MRFDWSLMVEVKAVSGTITLGNQDAQLLGLIDIAQDTLAGRSGLVPGAVLLPTTSDTKIGRSALGEATLRGVTVWQAKAFAELGPNGWQIGLSDAVLLNREVLARYPRLMNVQIFSANPAVGPALSPLLAPVSPRTSRDPDPTTVQNIGPAQGPGEEP
jgi:hypothetical protein